MKWSLLVINLLLILYIIVCKKRFYEKRLIILFCIYLFLYALSTFFTTLEFNFSMVNILLFKFGISNTLLFVILKIIKKFQIKKLNFLKIVGSKEILSLIFYSFCIFILTINLNFIKYYSNVPVEQLVFHLQVPITGTDSSAIIEFLKMPILSVLVFWLIAISTIWILNKIKLSKETSTKKNQINRLFHIKLWHVNILIFLFLVFSIINLTNKVELKEFILNQFAESNFISEHYVSPNSLDLSFPEKKRNLIYIFMESMESSYKNNEFNYIPNLTSLAETNHDLSIKSKFYQITGTTWTIASMVAQTSGLPLKFSVESETYNGNRDTFLSGVPTLGDILLKNGYKNYLYLGSDSAFAYRNLYFTYHGNYEIFDYIVAKTQGYIPEDYGVFWGFEDRKLFEFSKEKLSEISKNEEPFNFTILTVDTHATDGYLDSNCNEIFESQLENVIYCSDSMIGDFISWVQEQDFYKDTTIVLVGDHLYMANNPILSDDRSVYATIINSNSENDILSNREFSAVDMFPTTLNSLGVKIPGNRLGLGVSLYDDKKTLIEEFGYQFVNDELKKKSTFYKNLSLYK